MRKLLIFIVLTFTFSVFFLPYTFELQDASSVSTVIGPRSWPLFLLVFLMVLTVLLLIKTVVDKKKGYFEKDFNSDMDNFADAESPSASAQKDNLMTEKIADEKVTWFSKYRHFILFCATLFYVALMSFIGFMAATVIFIALTAVILGAKRIPFILLATVAGSSLIFVVFDYLLGIPLP